MRTYMVLLTIGIPLAVAVVLAGAPQRGAQTGASAAGQTSPSPFVGTIHAADGKALDGVVVSARATDQTFTTSVYTDDQGEYVFPSLPPGAYRVWAQAVGFATAHAEVTLVASHATVQALTMQPVKDFTSQLTGTEWLDALPEDTVDHRRMKQILRVDCADCHSMAVVLQSRFDEAGWRAILRAMEDTGYNGWGGNYDRPADMLGLRGQIVRHHRDELAKYLAIMRGPGPSPMVFKPLPRPSGEAARAVVTEYDVPIGERPNQLAWYNGDDWSEGPATGMHGTVGLHDVVIDHAGAAWISESRESWETDRTLTKLDVKTGETTAVKLVGPDGKIVFVEQMALDPKGNLWMHQNFGRDLIRLDPATEAFTLFLQPRGMGVGGRGGLNNSTDTDSRGRVWINGLYGSVRFDPATEKWQLFQQNSPNNGTTYGVAADADDNGWWSEFYGDKVAKMDLKTGKVQEMDMHDPQYDARRKLHTADDLEFYDSIGAETWGGGPAPYGNAPRRMAADKTSNTVWVPNWAGMNLAEIDIHTLKVTYHPLPIQGLPYHTFVDNQHNVWADVPMGDRFVKWNPKAQQWTVYTLPSHGCGSRHSSFDDVRGEAWMPCDQSGKVARFQFRTAQQIQAQKAAAATR